MRGDAAQRPPADARRRRLRRQGRGGRAPRRSSTSRSGAGSCRSTSTAWRSSPSAAWSASRRSCATAGSRTSRPPTTTRSTRAWRRRRRSACRWRSTPSATGARLRAPGGQRLACATASRRARSIAELEAIETAIALARDTGCSLHVVHVEHGRGVALVAEARAPGDVTCETCPHYLALDRGRPRGARARRQVRAAAARRAAEREALWREVGGRRRRRWWPPTTRRARPR